MSPGGTGPTTLAQLGEFSLIAALTEGAATAPDVLVGIGDDAAVLTVDGAVVTTVDALVEGVHFRRDWSSATDVGRKAVAVNVADLEAMGARPRGIVLAFSAPGELEVRWALDLAAGVHEECAAAGVSLLGGDTTRSRDVTLAVTAIGVLEGRSPVLRSGARPGHVVAVVGRLGWAGAGLLVLGRGFRSPRVLVEAQRVPKVPYGEGAAAAQAGATAMVDVSDGLLADLGHVARASGVAVDVRTEALDIAEPLQAVAAATGADPYRLALTGGEDHALAATFPSSAAVPTGWTVIGEVREAGPDGPEVTVDGGPYEGVPGFDHFRPSPGGRSPRGA